MVKLQGNRVGIYCRLSEEDRDKLGDDESRSIQNQKSLLLQYAMQQGWDVVNIYSDDDYAGGGRNRPGFKQILKDAEDGKIDIILCKSQARFTREIELVEKYLHGLFIEWGIRFVSIVDNADTSIPSNKKSRQINGLVNEWYLEDVSENIKAVLADKRQKGYHTGGIVLYGYQKDTEEKGHIIIDEEAADVVRDIFNMFNSGIGKKSIARMLNERGIPNPTGYKIQKGIYNKEKSHSGGSGTLWKYYTVSDILKNEMYIGNMVQYRYRSISYKTKQCKPTPKEQWVIVPGTHEPIIDKKTWDDVQEKIRLKAKPCYTGEVGIFAQKARCKYCKYIMYSQKQRQYRYLSCGTRKVLTEACIGSNIPERVLEKRVLDELKKLMKELLDTTYLEKEIQFTATSVDKRLSNIQKNILKNEHKQNEIDLSIKNLYIDKVKGIITEETFINLMQSLEEDRQKYQIAINRLSEQLNQIKRKNEELSSKQDVIEKYVNITELTRDIVVELIDIIYVGKKDSDTGLHDVEIHWKF